MNQTDQHKVMKAGFTIIRRSNEPSPRIKQKTLENPWTWVTLNKFDTKAARDRAADELLKSDNFIED